MGNAVNCRRGQFDLRSDEADLFRVASTPKNMLLKLKDKPAVSEIDKTRAQIPKRPHTHTLLMCCTSM